MRECLAELQPLVGRQLTETEWTQFEGIVDQMVVDLKEMLSRRPGQHPTTNWRWRQRRRGRQDNGANHQDVDSTEAPSTQPQSQDAANQQDLSSFQLSTQDQSVSLPSSQSSTQQPPPRRRRRHNRNARRAWVREAKKIQRWYS